MDFVDVRDSEKQKQTRQKNCFQIFRTEFIEHSVTWFFCCLVSLACFTNFQWFHEKTRHLEDFVLQKKTDSGKYNEIVSSTAHAQLHTIAITDIQNG